jgi:polysaccharide export outer membrane protein
MLTSCAHGNPGGIAAASDTAADGRTDGAVPLVRPVSPLDLLDITVLDAPEFTLTLRVSEQGQISLPLIGVLPAAGRTPHELEAELAGRLRGTYMVDPQVTVFLKEAAVDPIYVVGEVNQPGAFTPSGSHRLSVLQAVALARGTKPGASQAAVVIRTAADGSRSQFPVRLGDVLKGRTLDPVLQPNDIVYVPTDRQKSVALGVVNALVRVVTFRTVF